MAKGENPNETKRLEMARGITLQEAFNLYVDGLESKGRSPKTIDGYRYALDTYLRD